MTTTLACDYCLDGRHVRCRPGRCGCRPCNSDTLPPLPPRTPQKPRGRAPAKPRAPRPPQPRQRAPRAPQRQRQRPGPKPGHGVLSPAERKRQEDELCEAVLAFLTYLARRV